MSLDPDITDAEAGAQSVEACPACGAHRLATIDFPRIGTGTSYLPASEAVAIPTDSPRPGLPGIGCLECGAEWSGLDAFRAAQRGEDEPDDIDGVGRVGDAVAEAEPTGSDGFGP